MPYASPAQRAAIWATRKRKEVQPTRHEIAEYYSDPQVRQALLAQLRDQPVMAVQSLASGKKIVRRHIQGEPIQISRADFKGDTSDLGWFTDRRFAEFHPVVGDRTDKVWVDVDPGPNRTTESLKPLVKEVITTVRKLPDVKDVQLAYSGGRGFHVRGMLKKPEDTDLMRTALTNQLRRDFPQDDVVFKKPKGKQVRLDTSTLKRTGSIRALQSLNVDTGRVAVPLTTKELDAFKPESADVRSILKEREFAPGIPQSKRTHPLPEKSKQPQWTMAVQEHNARRAGKHWDLRLVDPHTGFAHSWAIPKARFPQQGDRPHLAIQTPTHSSDYALNFGATGPQEIGEGYGKGTVEIKHKVPAKIVSSHPDGIRFQSIIDGEPEEFVLFRTKDNTWLIRNARKQEKKGSDMSAMYEKGYFNVLNKLGVAKGVMTQPSMGEMQQPLEVDDQNTPAGMLAGVLSGMSEEGYHLTGNRSKQRQSAEDRLNRDVSWSSPTDIPTDFMDGPTPWVTTPGGSV